MRKLWPAIIITATLTVSASSAHADQISCSAFYESEPGTVGLADSRIGRGRRTTWNAVELGAAQNVDPSPSRKYVIYNHALVDDPSPSFLAVIAINRFDSAEKLTKDTLLYRNPNWTRRGFYRAFERYRTSLERQLNVNFGTDSAGTCAVLLDIYAKLEPAERANWYDTIDHLLATRTGRDSPVLFDGSPRNSDDDTFDAIRILAPLAKKRLSECAADNQFCECRFYYLGYSPYSGSGCSDSPVKLDMNTARALSTTVLAFSPRTPEMDTQFELDFQPDAPAR